MYVQKHEIKPTPHFNLSHKSRSNIKRTGAWFTKENFESQYFKDCKNECSVHLQQFFANNSYLRKKHGIKVDEQIQYFKEQGIKVHDSTVRKYKCGINKSCSLVYLSFFAEYWHISIPVMMGQDFEALDKLGKLDLDQLRG